MTNKIKWCPCKEFPENMCNTWPACVDINGIMWGTLEKFQKFRNKNKDIEDKNEE